MAKAEGDAQVQTTQQLLGEWMQEVAMLRSRYNWLLYVNMPKLLQLYHLVHSLEPADEARVNSIVHEVSFLAPNKHEERETLRTEVQVRMVRDKGGISLL